MSLRLGFGKLVNVGIHILPSITSKELQFCIIPQRILSVQIARNYSDRFSIAPKKKKIRSVRSFEGGGVGGTYMEVGVPRLPVHVISHFNSVGRPVWTGCPIC